MERNVKNEMPAGQQHVDGVDMSGKEVVDCGDEQAEIFEIGQQPDVDGDVDSHDETHRH